ncbi:MAG: hypothetical protein U9Q68_01055, partial [Euryarchaeota archaeon]|nr:hypothetical protein [Euryarchaeota archaeon]
CDAAHVKIGYVAPLQYKNNIFWIFKNAISRNYEKGMVTCGMSGRRKFSSSDGFCGSQKILKENSIRRGYKCMHFFEDWYVFS